MTNHFRITKRSCDIRIGWPYDTGLSLQARASLDEHHLFRPHFELRLGVKGLVHTSLIVNKNGGFGYIRRQHGKPGVRLAIAWRTPRLHINIGRSASGRWSPRDGGELKDNRLLSLR